jgi:hypothetical protein
VPIVFYQGTKKYNAPTNLWDLFTHPDLAKKLLIEDHLLINLREKTDQEALGQKHIGIMEYFLKHAKCNDAIQLWKNFFSNVPYNVKENKSLIDIYFKPLLSYTEVKLDESKINELDSVVHNNLSEDNMPTFAEHFIQKGFNEGISQGISEGINKGKLEGIKEGARKGFDQGAKNTKHRAAINLLKQGISSDVVSSALDLSRSAVHKIKQELFESSF